MIASSEEPFPDDALDEIRRERNLEELDIPPCSVELVVGLPGEQRLYTVLPTGVVLAAPFSCNAPFVQDPARSAIKSPSLSPTNRWLLHRIGRLAGTAMLEWLGNESLEPGARAQAYSLLPGRPSAAGSLDADVESVITEGFVEGVGQRPVLLTTAGGLADSADCIAPPRLAHEIWTPAQLVEVLGTGGEQVLSGAVSEKHRRRLSSWEWLDIIDETSLTRRLASGRQIPRPAQNGNLLALWAMVQRNTTSWQRRGLAIVPTEGSDRLLPAEEVVRLSAKSATANDKSSAFLVELVQMIDGRWVRYLKTARTDDESFESARQLLRDLDLDAPSDANAIVRFACRSLFGRSRVSIRDHVRIAHLMAGLNVRTPEEFRCVTRDRKQRLPSDGIVATQDPAVEALLPEDWSATHLLHDAYFKDYEGCTRQQWQDWVSSKRSGFLPFVPLNKTKVFRHSFRHQIREFLESRASTQSVYFYTQVQQVTISDFGFPDHLEEHWNATTEDEEDVWAKVTERVLRSPDWYWKDCLRATLSESNYTHTRSLCSSVVSELVMRLSSQRCLYDTHGRAYVPAELYLRTPATEPLLGVEPFVQAELDTEATKPLLRSVGVRDTPAGLNKLLDRVRSLARSDEPKQLLSEIVKWYGALDRALARATADDLREIREAFASEALVLTDELEWTRAPEVFQYASEEELPGAHVVHQAANSLGMWARLGVAAQPTSDLVLNWLDGLPSGGRLESGLNRRVRSALQRHPVEVWQTCSHWLTLDNAWTPVERLRYRVTMQSLTKWTQLFPAVKAATANLQMLSADVCDREPFASLPDLGMSVEYRLTERPVASAVRKPWLSTLAHSLMRVRLSDEAETKHIRGVSERLARSLWQPFDDGGSLRVTPYLCDAPAGEPYSPVALWHDRSIFVRNGTLARSFEAIVSELARPFVNESVTEALKACIERDESFVADYLEEHFTLDTSQPEDVTIGACELEGGAHAGETADDEEGGASTSEGDTDGWLGGEVGTEEGEEDEGGHEYETPAPPRRRKSSLFERFARGCGYQWDHVQNRFVHPDGSWIKRCEPPFHWCRFDSVGDLTVRYWASSQQLNGIKIAAVLWDLIRRSPAAASLVVAGDDAHPCEVTGVGLLRLVDEGVLTLYPAKYLIREEPGG